ncbi:uncharacterized protein LOC118433475 [Folsomia candida]|uniref:uncharacterized protein LOC118433475 n=1 Tax=Folsomia candida TaxID=158441 RepID=UPI001604A421|nr:uncharacterized protein LOC118433475 [Folsomia candida]
MYPLLKIMHCMKYCFPKVRKLEISSIHWQSKSPEFKDMVVSIVPKLVALFPNVVSLSNRRCDQIVVETFLKFSPQRVKSLKFVSLEFTRVMQENVSCLTRLEIDYYLGTWQTYSELLKLASATLQHVKFFNVANWDYSYARTWLPHKAIVFPIMSKLRVFELSLSPYTKGSEIKPLLVTLDIFLKFEKGDAIGRLDYQAQFPFLEKIKISRETTFYHFREEVTEKRLTEWEYFETSVSFMYRYFLHDSNSQGIRVKYLDIPFPPGDSFRLTPATKCNCGKARVLCECVEMKSSSEFWDRVVEIFPNLERYEVIREAWERAKVRRVTAAKVEAIGLCE